MSRKRNKTVAELEAAKAQAIQERDTATATIKALSKQISEAARRERSKHIYTRGGELTHHLQDNTELLTDDDVKLFLEYVFSFSRTQKLVSDMLAIRRGEAEGSVEELVRSAMPGYTRTTFRETDAQTS